MFHQQNAAPYVIAEIGSNFRRVNEPLEQSLLRAELLIGEAARCGASAVKFQCFSEKALYGFGDDSCAPWAFPVEHLARMRDVADREKVELIVSPFDVAWVPEIAKYAHALKIASSDFCFRQMWDACLYTGLPVIASYGACSRSNVFDTLVYYRKSVACGYCEEVPLAFLECVSAYPAKAEDYDFGSFGFLMDTPVIPGVSLHCGPEVAYAACALGGSGFEFNLSSVLSAETPDGPVSYDSTAFKSTIESLKSVHKAVSTIHPSFSASEQEFVLKHRRRLIAIKDINPGDVLRFGKNFGAFRSHDSDALGDTPLQWNRYEGKTALVQFPKGKGIFSLRENQPTIS